MISFARFVTITAKVLAAIWIGLLILGLIGKLAVFVRDAGFLSGILAWVRWFDPTNPLNLLVHLVELIPAFALYWLADRCKRWADLATIRPRIPN